jgi:hypothetical protein
MIGAKRSGLNDPAERIAHGLETLRVLAEDGANLALPRLVTHSFTGKGEGLEFAAIALKGSGYAIEQPDEETVFAEAMTVTDEGWLREAMAILCRVADHFGVEYEGWEAQADQALN